MIPLLPTIEVTLPDMLVAQAVTDTEFTFGQSAPRIEFELSMHLQEFAGSFQLGGRMGDIQIRGRMARLSHPQEG